MQTLAQIAKLVDGEVIGDAARTVNGVASLGKAQADHLSFINHVKYRSELLTTQAGVVLLNRDFLDDCPVPAIVTANPYLAYARAASVLSPRQQSSPGIHPAAVVAADCQFGLDVAVAANAVIGRGVVLGDRVQIGAGCVIGDGVRIGQDSFLYPNVTVYHDCCLGQHVTLHSGAVIGADGFGYAPDGGAWVKIPQVGRTILGDRVEIGANTTIDRGAIDDTVIGHGVIIDNLVQIGHNVHIGDNSAIAACAAIAGSTHIGKHCTIAGAVGIVGHIHIADHVHVTAMTMVTHSIDTPGAYSSGTTAEPNASWHRNAVRFKQLDQLAKRLKLIEKKILNG